MNRPPLLVRLRRPWVLWPTGALALALVAGGAQALAHSPHQTSTAGGTALVAAPVAHPGGAPGAHPAPSATRSPRPSRPPGVPPRPRRAFCLHLDAADVKAVVAAAGAEPGTKGSVAAPMGKDGGVALALTATRLVPCPAGVTAPPRPKKLTKPHRPGPGKPAPRPVPRPSAPATR